MIRGRAEEQVRTRVGTGSAAAAARDYCRQMKNIRRLLFTGDWWQSRAEQQVRTRVGTGSAAASARDYCRQMKNTRRLLFTGD